MRRFQWMPTRWIQRRTNSSIHHKNKISYTSIVHSTPISSYVYTSPHQYYDIFGHLSLGDGRQYSTISSILPHIHVDAPSYAQYQLQLKLLQSYTRCYNTSSSSKHLPFKDCQTVKDAVQMLHTNLQTSTPRNLSAFWSSVPQLLKKSRFEKVQNIEQMNHHLDDILGYTLQDINSFGSRDLAQTALGLAKIVKNVSSSDGKRLPRYGTPQRILYDLIVGEKEFIFKVLAEPSMVILHKYPPRELSNLVYAYGLAEYVIKFNDGSTLFDIFAQAAIPNLDKFNGQDLSNMLWSYANVNVPNSQLFKQAGDAIVATNNLDNFKPQELSNILWAYATLDEQHTELFKKVADHIAELDNLTEFRPQNLSNTLWAYATAEETHPQLFEKVAEHIIRLDSLNNFKPQELKDILWAFAKSGRGDPRLFKKVANHIVELDSLRSFNEQALSNIVWSYATARESHPQLFKKVADHIVSLDTLRTFNGQDCSNTVWAFATASESHPHLFKKLAEEAIKRQHEFKPQELKDIVWAFATAGESQPQLFNKLADEAIKRQHEFIPQEISNFLWAHAANGQVDEHLFSSLVPSVKDNLDKYNAQELANVAWAYSVANVNAPSVFNKEFINACLRNEESFELEELRQLHQWQLWQEEIKSDNSLPESLQKRCYEAFISQEISTSRLQDDVVSSLLSMGLQPHEEVLLKSGYRIDAVVEVNGNQIAVEVDGPSHFIGRELTGSTIIKHRQVASVDEMKVVSIPYWDWNKLKKDSKRKEQYLQDLLRT